MIKLIWAMDHNWLIGNGDRLPWHYKEDLIYYKENTRGKAVLMGDVTYYSLKGYYKDKPLPYGKIYVASLKDLTLPDATVITNLKTFLENYQKDEELWVVGGATVYQLALPYADYLYITFVNGNYCGDRYFPKFDLNKAFKLISSRYSDPLEFTVYERK